MATFAWELSKPAPAIGLVATFTFEAWEHLVGNVLDLVETCTWQPLLANLGNLHLGTFTCWKPLLGNLLNLVATFAWELRKTCRNLRLATCFWQPLLANLRNLHFGTFPLLGNLCAGTLEEWVLEMLRPTPTPLL